MPRPPLPLYWRVFAVNAGLLTAIAIVLVVAPVTISFPIAVFEGIGVVVGLVVTIAINAVLLRHAFAPLARLEQRMETVDLLRPGQRLQIGRDDEIGSVLGTFNRMLDRLEAERQESGRRVLAAQEAERRRIAQELHDQIGQNLTAVVLELKRVRAQVDGGEAEALADAQELARETLEEVRRISYELRPAALDDLGLPSALRSLCAGIEKRAGIVVDLDVPDSLPELDPQVELAIYRVAQEALTNAVRHAHCHAVRVFLGPVGEDILLHVADDGVGMDGSFPGGGLRGMRERAVAVGAAFETRSARGRGVEVSMRVPAAGAG